MAVTLYWHDYETWGADPSVDRPCQFAGLRTDAALQVIDEPLVLFCQPPDDVLPHPDACLITGISPQKAYDEGLAEPAFAAAIQAQLAVPGTCGVGYNSLRFDDEVTRFMLYRNFFDPYEREWKNGNSRWDIIDMVRLCYALRPGGLEWPMIDGRPSFRLEDLAEANGLQHTSAHDALSDVEATIALARLIKERQPALFRFAFEHRLKAKCATRLDVMLRKPALHVSSMFGVERGCVALIVPLAMHPSNANAVICFDLSADPADLIRLDAAQIAQRVFTAQEDLSEGEKRVPLKLVHLNKCPLLLPPKMLDTAAARRLGIDRARCEQHWQLILQHDLAEKVRAVFAQRELPPREDPERMLYNGFIGDADKRLMARLREADAETLADARWHFQDVRLNELQWRYRARHFPASLTDGERMRWMEFCTRRLTEGGEGVQSIAQLRARIRELDESAQLGKREKILLQQLYRYADELARKYQLGRKCSW